MKNQQIYTTFEELSQIREREGGLTKEDFDSIQQKFNVRIPSTFLRGGHSELLNQVLPSNLELDTMAQERIDPIGDKPFEVLPGLIHRYPNRVLLLPTYLCAMYCRFCFRREKVSKNYAMTSKALDQIFDYIGSHTEIQEVILSGGDPLILGDNKIMALLGSLYRIGHIQSIRFHTRILSAEPNRVQSSRLLNFFSDAPKQIWIVSHVNSVDEIGPGFIASAKILRKTGVGMLSQSVLLKGVNSSLEQLRRLFQGLIAVGIKPYYLHYPDLAMGTNHFRIPLDEAVHLYDELRGCVSGIAIPQFVVDIPGGYGKISIASENIKFHKDPRKFSFLSPINKEWIAVEYPASSVQ